MRIQLRFLPGENSEVITIPQDFRRKCISALKRLISDLPLFKRYEMEKPGYAPFGMAVEFARVIKVERDSEKIQIQPPMIMSLSSGDMKIFTEFCNAAIEQRGKLNVLGMSLTDLNLLPPVTFHSGKVEFKTQGHMALRSKDGYLGDNDRDLIEEAINYHLFTRADYLHRQWDIKIPDLDKVRVCETDHLHRGVCLHYGGFITTLTGRLTLEGSGPSLQFLYDYGIGNRSGQGYGLIKVVNCL